MEVQWRLWSKDWTSFVRPWIPILLGLHLQFSRASNCPEECRCDRTFVYCNERSLTSVPMGIGEGYKTLYLHNNQINNAGFPAELHHVASVETVYLYGNQLDEFPINLPKNVKVLHLQENNIQTISRAALAQLLWLEELHLDDNSISTVGVEEGAFREAVSLKMLFLTKNHLSSVPIGLPDDLKELRLDENRIAVIAEEAFQNVTRLERLLLDGNLLTDEGISPGTFQDLVTLRELSLARNSLTYPPLSLPREVLVKLSFQENQMSQIPEGAFSGLRKLERLDISNNQLQSLPQGVFDGLASLRQLFVRNNPWLCDCTMTWVVSWLRSLPTSLNARGFMCHKPEKFRGMVIRELSADLVPCPQSTSRANTAPKPSVSASTDSPSATQHAFSSSSTRRRPIPTLPTLYPIYTTREEGMRTKQPLQVKFTTLNGSAIHVSWMAAFPVTAYKVTWARMGPSLTGDTVRERIVGGDHRGIRLSNLEPKSTYRICVIPLDEFNNYRPKDDTVCTEAVTTAAFFSPDNNNRRRSGPEQASQRESGSPFLLAGLIGGAVIVVLVVLLGIFCWHMHKKSRSKWKYNRGRRKDDYCEAGTKKDNSLLEMTETGFQIASLNNEQLLKGEFRIQPIYTPNGGVGFRDCPPGNNSTVYCKNNVQDADFCHS
ncbi:leucine-rich repeat transmembrane protein FLRT2 [Melanotaenia boesemani]|uniref:leucine-rich repeat transmembrane protein FLRT2 n=1 Tax=Melanotaenia boesemani TaxID=1250792 RepID=UPI001C05B32D|nr:leucine-rich repeat transmembrane protein FLRT2 [Melanotaenia boesemani]XP_041826981.1 leucine-rich repeat transmembrane protein FLRT2 [Melanotaenia boesemani]XP_041826983.1 leucine-rich repeat transmembrane protein FLRT2 [Melanotaenia boesemani]XP_041826984.1 leucine-rich repeat transmembrane protein FLRT2 [Melanotaenia boesemani]